VVENGLWRTVPSWQSELSLPNLIWFAKTNGGRLCNLNNSYRLGELSAYERRCDLSETLVEKAIGLACAVDLQTLMLACV
jgi:hypothetical protein